MHGTHMPCTNGLKVADQPRKVDRRVPGNKQMNMVGFTIELRNFTTPALRDPFKLLAHLRKHFSCEAFMPVFRHKYDMKVQGESRMTTGF